MRSYFGIWRVILTVMLALFGIAIGFSQGGPAGVLNGSIYEDANDNGVRDVDDVGLANHEFVIVGPQGYQQVKSGPTGQILVSGLLPGRYTVIPPLQANGRVLVTTNPIGIIDFNLAPSGSVTLNLGYHKECVTFGVPKILWEVGPNGPTGNATVTVTVNNLNPWAIGWVYVTPLGPGTITPNPIPVNPPIPGNGSGTITFTLSGVQPQEEYCFIFEFHSPDLVECCAEQFCFKTPECDCFQIIEEHVECLPNGTFQLNFTLQNLTNYTVNKVWTLGLGGATTNPIVHNVPATPPGGLINISTVVTGANLGGTNVCIRIMLYNGGFQCCVKDVCFPFPNCNNCDNRAPICYAKRPTYNATVDGSPVSYNGADWAALNGKTVSAVTCFASYTVDSPSTPMRDDLVFGYVNQDQYQCAPPTLGVNWALTPMGFHNGLDGPFASLVPMDCLWTKKYMGNVFAITFDNEGNAYVAQTSAYNCDYAPRIQDFNQPATPGRNHSPSPNEVADRRLHGRIFKIANGTGKVTIFNEDTTSGWNGMPSAPDPLINSLPNAFPGSRPELELSSQAFPEVGDVTFDYDHNQIFATCMDDGKIYRYNMAGQKLGSFDPWAADGAPVGSTGDGFADWDENIWALKYHKGRLYFSRWREDFDNFAAGNANEVWSIDVTASGGFGPVGTERFELATPDLVNTNNQPNATAPISDISFQQQRNSVGVMEAQMLLAERGMGSTWAPGGGLSVYEQMNYHATNVNPLIKKAAFTNTYPHRARGLMYKCDPQTLKWQVQPTPYTSNYFNLGSSGNGGNNCAGGVDFDFDDRGCSGSPLGNRSWFTSDYMYSMIGQYVYGLQGLPLTGGAIPNSILIDLNGVTFNGEDKTTIADVETPCPAPSGGADGTILMPHWMGPVEGRVVKVEVIGNNFFQEFKTVLDSTGRFYLDAGLANGTYSVYLTLPGHLTMRKSLTINNANGALAPASLAPGDVNCDNEVDSSDFDMLVVQYGQSGYLESDMNGDLEVGSADFDLMVSHYGWSGDYP